MSSLSRTKARRIATDLIAELEDLWGRPATLVERRAAFAVASRPVLAASRLRAIEESLARLEEQGESSLALDEEATALSEAFAGAVRCSRCGMGLTDPTSVAAGMGPDCRSKGAGA